MAVGNKHYVALPRACGKRKPGGMYIETGQSDDGMPVEYFLLDPPLKITPRVQDALGIKALGVTIVGRPNPKGRIVYHVIDWVGQEYYPNVADFVEEVRRQGLSRRIPMTAEFARLTSDSRILLVHPRAWVENYASYREVIVRRLGLYCPKGILEHLDATKVPTMCDGVWWNDIEDGDGLPDGTCRRVLPGCSYVGQPRPRLLQPAYTPGLFLSLPISRIAIINDAERGIERQTEALFDCDLPHVVLDE